MARVMPVVHSSSLSLLFPRARVIGPEMPSAVTLGWADNDLRICLGGGLMVAGTDSILGQRGEVIPAGVLADDEDRTFILAIGPSTDHFHLLGAVERGDPVERWYACRLPRAQLPTWCDDGLGRAGRRTGPECHLEADVRSAPESMPWLWGVVVLPVPAELLAAPSAREIAGLGQ